MFTQLVLISCLLLLVEAQQFPNDLHKYWNNAGINNISQFKFPSINLENIKKHLEESNVEEQSQCMTKFTSLITNFGSSDPTKALESLYFADAAGKPSSGLVTGNIIMIGDYEQCLTMKNSSAGYYDSCTVAAKALLGSVYPVTITWTGCLPLECRFGNASDVETEIYNFINKYLGGALFLIPGQATRTCAAPMEWDTGAFVASAVMSLVSLLVFIGTLWYSAEPVIKSFTESAAKDTKLLIQNEETENISEEIEPISIQNGGTPETAVSASKPISNDETNDSSRLARIGLFFKCFALQRTFGILTSTDTKPGQILCINGIRVLSINWVVLGHTYFVLNYVSATPSYALTLIKRRSFHLILNGLPSVDSFFTLSGFLVSYLLLKQLKNGMSSLKWIAYYVHRYVRLTIPYGIVILVEGFMYRLWINGNFIHGSDAEYSSCKDYWWANILYVNNFVPKMGDKVCLGQSWYLSNDMQFYMVAPIFIILLFRTSLGGLAANVGAIIASLITTAALTYHYKLGPASIADRNINDFHILYNKPYIRITPYIVGILGGWLYWKFGQGLRVSVSRMSVWKQVMIGAPIWLVTAAVQYAVVFGLYDDILLVFTEGKDPSVADSISYQMFARLAWGMSLTVQILACQCGLGGFINSLLSWKGWLVLARLTYAVYLLHFGMLLILFYEARHPFYFTPDFNFSILYLGILMMSYLAAIVLYVTVEQPVAFLESLAYRKQKK